MEQAIDIINRVLPILFLISLGSWIRHSGFLADSTIEDLRRIVVNLALPAVLFISFLGIELKPAYFFIFAFTFALPILLFLLGNLLKKWLAIEFIYFPYLTTGFEYGMLGVSLFGSAYGLAEIGYIAVADLGHEIFIWFVFLPLLLVKRDGSQSIKDVGRAFISSPVILAIIASLVFNVLGAREALYQLPLTGAMMSTLEFLANLTIPLILMIVGYGIKIDRTGLKDALLVAGVRLTVLLPLALIINIFFIRGFLQLEPLFEAAVFTLLILPPPFIIPLYARANLEQKQKQYINNVLTVHTVISVGIFIIYFVLSSYS